MSYIVKEPSQSIEINKSLNNNNLTPDKTNKNIKIVDIPSSKFTDSSQSTTNDISSYTNLSPLPTIPYLQNEIGTSIPKEYKPYKKQNILNKDNLFSYTDYNNMILSKENNNLNELNNLTNNDLLKNANNKRFFNLSLKEIIDKTILTVVSIFIDLLKLMKPEESIKRENMNYIDNIGVFLNIFIKNDRMVYVGVFLIFISLLFMVVFLSS